VSFLVFCSLLLLGAGGWFAWRRWQVLRRNSLRDAPFPDAWRVVLEGNVGLYRKLPLPLRAQLHGHIQVFLHNKTFLGCAGFEVTDEVRLIVAAQACVLLLNRETDYFPGFTSILIYPGSYVARAVEQDGPIAGVTEDVRAGESWHRGPVVLSWQDVLRGARETGDAFNVVIHEFAHKLDEENAHSAGVPLLDDASLYDTWAEVFSGEYAAMRAGCGESGALDDYGANSPAEFFAVATETFFECPHALAQKHGELYRALMSYYKVDPCAWSD
jgi:Mlc titration factor MtfA (ptsG expression regulator)